jgi:hypothetical protein
MAFEDRQVDVCDKGEDEEEVVKLKFGGGRRRELLRALGAFQMQTSLPSSHLA